MDRFKAMSWTIIGFESSIGSTSRVRLKARVSSAKELSLARLRYNMHERCSRSHRHMEHSTTCQQSSYPLESTLRSKRSKLLTSSHPKRLALSQPTDRTELPKTMSKIMRIRGFKPSENKVRIVSAQKTKTTIRQQLSGWTSHPNAARKCEAPRIESLGSVLQALSTQHRAIKCDMSPLSLQLSSSLHSQWPEPSRKINLLLTLQSHQITTTSKVQSFNQIRITKTLQFSHFQTTNKGIINSPLHKFCRSSNRHNFRSTCKSLIGFKAVRTLTRINR